MPFNRLTAFNASGITTARNRGRAGMADATEDPEIAAARLEAALERIAKVAAAPHENPQIDIVPPMEPYIVELVDRIDSLIDRLRDALTTK